jgi:hypothetical protein
MSVALNALLNDILGRIEEVNPPVFWSLIGEVYPQMVDGMFEAALITGTVQTVNVPVTISANATYFLSQGGVGFGGGGFGGFGFGGTIGIPEGVIAPLRMKAPYPIRKVTLKGMDDMIPGWQQAAPGSQIIAWGPIGVSQFFIYPQLAASATVIMDFIMSPVNEVRPYTGNETIPFQVEFQDALSQYAAALLRAKEGGAEAEESAVVYQAYLSRMKALSAFSGRLDSLVFTGAYGGRTQPNPRTEV